MDLQSQLSAPPACHLLIFTAVPTERKELLAAASAFGIRPAKGKSSIGDYFDLGTVGQSRVLAVETQMGPFSWRGSAAKALQWLAATEAQAVIGVGMAFGTLPGRQQLGDVLVATSLLPYDHKIVRCGPTDEPVVDYKDVKSYPAHPGLHALFERAAREPRWHGLVHFGPFLSGASRIHCSKHRDELCRELSDRGQVVGGDMEGIGLLASSDETESRWIMVKGISDFADSARDSVITRTRPTACYNSASFVLSALFYEETLRVSS